jgi:hypothetical protein
MLNDPSTRFYISHYRFVGTTLRAVFHQRSTNGNPLLAADYVRWNLLVPIHHGRRRKQNDRITLSEEIYDTQSRLGPRLLAPRDVAEEHIPGISSMASMITVLLRESRERHRQEMEEAKFRHFGQEFMNRVREIDDSDSRTIDQSFMPLCDMILDQARNPDIRELTERVVASLLAKNCYVYR